MKRGWLDRLLYGPGPWWCCNCGRQTVERCEDGSDSCTSCGKRNPNVGVPGAW